MCKKVNESGKNQPSDEHGGFPKIDALMKGYLKTSVYCDYSTLFICLAKHFSYCHETYLHCTHFRIVARIFFSPESNQQRISSQYVDFSCYEKFDILMIFWSLTHLCVSPAREAT